MTEFNVESILSSDREKEKKKIFRDALFWINIYEKAFNWGLDEKMINKLSNPKDFDYKGLRDRLSHSLIEAGGKDRVPKIELLIQDMEDHVRTGYGKNEKMPSWDSDEESRPLWSGKPDFEEIKKELKKIFFPEKKIG